MRDTYVVHNDPTLESPVLILALRGWVDAGLAMFAAIQEIKEQSEPSTLVTFAADSFIDYRARRPTLTLIDGVNTAIDWPYIEVLAGHDLDGRDVLILWGDEPDSNWMGFVAAIRDLAKRFGVTRAVTIGGYPAAVPHTRPIPLTITATAEALIDPTKIIPGRIELPAGITAAIERGLAEIGIPSIGIWAQVPHYAANLAHPTAAVALIEALADRGERRFEANAELRRSGDIGIAELDELIDRSPDRRQMVAELERVHDSGGLAGIDGESLPTGEDLAAEVEEFLRGNDPEV